MKQWGIFTTKKELNKIKRKIEKNGLEIFEVRELTFIEKLTYVNDPLLFVNEPHVIMFNATDEEYNTIIKKLKLTPVF